MKKKDKKNLNWSDSIDLYMTNLTRMGKKILLLSKMEIANVDTRML